MGLAGIQELFKLVPGFHRHDEQSRHTGMGLAGIQNYLNWTPAFAGVTNSGVIRSGMGLAGIQE